MSAEARDAGGFRARNDPPSSFYRVALECNYVEGARVEAIRKAITECYTEALAELERRFGDKDNRRQRAGGERR